MTNIFIKRIYEPCDEADGTRILVDRIWPRGISKEKAGLTDWFKDIAPSSELRKWFCHKPELFEEFREKYLEELRIDERKAEMVAQLSALAQEGRVTLLYGAKDPIHNQAVVLYEEIKRKLAEK
ncbi:DUF488 domain-containing protein [Bacillus sp. EB600]|uniref:DUF488 domain-containing protein n=1 Tax=Bacillus sp. EB600 TaxID=2806345 RepID=UPI00210BE195|nr:DUF488 domain-containing protein [Bacillus sp. EB600]MCQ6281928.1 DUF488 domain-containing protein [Bacillus sp. EB600]